jgi:hypothetical protein
MVVSQVISTRESRRGAQLWIEELAARAVGGSVDGYGEPKWPPTTKRVR